MFVLIADINNIPILDNVRNVVLVGNDTTNKYYVEVILMIETKYFCDLCGIQVLVNYQDKEMHLKLWELKAEPHKRFGNLGNIQNIYAHICENCKKKIQEQLTKQHELLRGNT